MHIRILLCDRFPGLLPEYVPSYDSMFARLFEGLAECEVFNTLDGVLPPLDGNADIHLITGSNNGACDNIPWIKNLLEWIREANAMGMRMIGVCFGHQAIAEALGGKVVRSPKGWGVGVRESRVCGEGLRWFPGGVMRLLYNHHDEVTVLPPGAIRVAYSDFCPNDAFTVGDNILSFQGHPEYLPEYAVHLLMNFSTGEPVQTCATALRSIGLHRHDGAQVARWICGKWT